MNIIDFEDGRKLPLVEDFYTIQGEGFHTGKPAYFIRLGGCDVGCSWCDAKFTWNSKLHPPVDVEDVIKRANSFPAQAIVITGGEPLLYPLDYITSELHSRGLDIFLETSGSHALSGRFDWICLSPKRQLPPVASIFPLAHELKIIVTSEADFAWAEENAAKVSKRCMLYLQPEWSQHDKIVPLIVEYVKNNPKWNVSVQTHKFMNIP